MLLGVLVLLNNQLIVQLAGHLPLFPPPSIFKGRKDGVVGSVEGGENWKYRRERVGGKCEGKGGGEEGVEGEEMEVLKEKKLEVLKGKKLGVLKGKKLDVEGEEVGSVEGEGLGKRRERLKC
jgi:hypothetical protein